MIFTVGGRRYCAAFGVHPSFKSGVKYIAKTSPITEAAALSGVLRLTPCRVLRLTAAAVATRLDVSRPVGPVGVEGHPTGNC